MIKINMGCGKRNFGKDWIHIDEANFDHIDHNNIFDFPYENVELIYASHLISYFDLENLNKLLTYWKSKLIKGGILRLGVPDFEKISFLYKNGWDLDYFIGPLYGKMNCNDNIIFHKICFDKKSLTTVLLKNGFKNVRPWDHKLVDHGDFDDHSQAYLPHMDKENGILISLNLECEK